MNLFGAEDAAPITTPGALAVDFWPTPSWLPPAIVERYLPDLTQHDVVLEPTCGDGSFLRAIPDGIPGYGVEIDPVLAATARATSSREVLVGDILTITLPQRPTVVLGNPPFQQAFVEALIARMHALLDENARMILLLSVHLFQTSTTIARYADLFSLDVELVPRDVYRGLERALVLTRFTKNAQRRIVGIAFADEIADLKAFPREYRAVLERSRTNVWVAACERALRELGRPATVAEIAERITGCRPTPTEFWRPAIRKALQHSFKRTAPATYALPDAA